MKAQPWTTLAVHPDDAVLRSKFAPERLHQSVQQFDLRDVDGATGGVERKEFRAIDLRNVDPPARPRRPFRRRHDARQARRIAVTFEGPGVHDFAAALGDRAERQKRSMRGESCFFVELANRGGERILARVNPALGNRPRAVVATLPEWASRV